MFMVSKDDNLLLQMGSLFNSIILSSGLSDELKQSVPELFGEYQPPPEEEERKDEDFPQGMKFVKNKTDMLNVYFDILITDMPFRNFTLRFYTRMLLENEPNFRLSAT